MVTDRKKDSDKTPVKQGPEKVPSEPNKIGSQQESDRMPISRGFLEGDKFDLGRGHALRFE